MTTIKYLAPDTDAYVDSVQRHKAEFTEQTGMDLEVRIIDSDQYFSNDIQGYLSGDDPPDVFMSGPVLLWEHVGAGLVEPLDSFVESSTTDFDLGDFFDPLILSNRWGGQFGDPLGSGSLWEIPVNCEAYNLTYVPELLARYGVQVPSTWSEYFDAARQIYDASEGQVRGFAQRGIGVWHTMYTGYASQFWAYGATDFDDGGRCAIASPEGIAATTDFVEALRQSGPRDLLNQRWYELAMDFCAGDYGFIVDSDHYVAFYEDVENSAIAGRTDYSLPLMGPSGRRESNLWTWSVVMNSHSSQKTDAWRFIEWAAGKDFLRRSAFEGNMNPTRATTWDDDEVREMASGWGDFYDVARQLVGSDARVLVTPTPAYLQLADRWVEGIRAAFAGECSVETALQSAAHDIDALIASKA